MVSEYGGQIAKTPADAAEGADFVMCCVGNDDDLREVTIGKNGAFSKLSQGFNFCRSYYSFCTGYKRTF